MIAIIGAGPAGCYAAYLLAKKGFKVKVFEEHNRIGKPVQCTGIVSPSIQKIIKIPRDIILNKTEFAEVIAPNSDSVRIKLNDIVLDRERFDNFLADKARDAGAEIFLNCRFLNYENRIITIKNKKNNKIKTIKTDILIGADGPLSAVAKCTGLFGKREFYHGIQARVKIKTDAKIYRTFFGSICPDFFAWVVPESSSIARVGLASKKNAKKYFNGFIEKIKKQNKIKIMSMQSGLIPVYNPKLKTQLKTKKHTIYMIGDAATQVKATTGGGIIQSLIAAESVAEAIETKKSYEKLWRKRMGMDLLLHFKARNMLNRFSDSDYNYLIKLMKQKKLRSILETHEREQPSRFLFKLIAKEPRFIAFFPRLFFR